MNSRSSNANNDLLSKNEYIDVLPNISPEIAPSVKESNQTNETIKDPSPKKGLLTSVKDNMTIIIVIIIIILLIVLLSYYLYKDNQKNNNDSTQSTNNSLKRNNSGGENTQYRYINNSHQFLIINLNKLTIKMNL